MKLTSKGGGISVSDKKVYYLNYKDVGGVSRRRKCGAKSLAEARRELQNIKNTNADLKSGVIMPTAVEMARVGSLDELASKYFELNRSDRHTVRRYENWVGSELGGKGFPISSLDLLEFQNRLEGRKVPKRVDGAVVYRVIAPATVNLVMSLFKTVVNWGIRHKLVEGEAVEVRKVAVSNHRERLLSSAEISMLFDRLREDVAKSKPSRAGGMSRGSSTKHIAMRNLVVCGLGLYTGARPASYLGLRREDVSVDAEGYPVSIFYAGRKGGKGVEFPVHDKLRAVLGMWLETLPEGSEVRLFDVSYSSVKRSLSGVFDELFNVGLDRYDLLHRVSLYSLRHTFATMTLEETGNIYLVSSALGHRQIETTKRYAKLTPDMLVKGLGAVKF